MVKMHTLHKFAGISSGVFLLILAISGFVLDHDYWRSFYKQVHTTDQVLLEKEKRLFNAIAIKNDHVVVGAMQGVFEKDKDHSFSKTFSGITTKVFPYKESFLLVTDDGIYKKINTKWIPYGLQGHILTTASLYNDTLIAVEEKNIILIYDLKEKKLIKKTTIDLPELELQEDIKLSRFIRDLHYGRGIFENSISLLLNDYATLVLIFLSLSGYFIWYRIHQRKSGKLIRKLIKLHSNVFILFASIFLMILAITGIFLDHSKAFAPFLKSTTVPSSFLPPVYHSLKEDIWSIDYDGERYRIGNRFGVYGSDDLKCWELENRGFAYRFVRKNDTLYISGMGAPNRILKDSTYTIYKYSPHMFKDIFKVDGITYFLTSTTQCYLPELNSISLYTLFLSLHDGSFFASWWIWINDFAAVMLIILIISGTYRWWHKKRR
ncbi:MAG: PepSY domain-containing protein [Epsilonproteobacteria bacterium]|nr:PepSY domain-containing protein [Campylobacterota bacterium]